MMVNPHTAKSMGSTGYQPGGTTAASDQSELANFSVPRSAVFPRGKLPRGTGRLPVPPRLGDRTASPLRFPPLLAALLLLCCAALTASARTITLKPDALDAFATLSESHPRNGWAAQEAEPALFLSNLPVGTPGTSFLLRYSFDQIPKGNRITHAEWIIPCRPPSATTVNVWRVIADWGIGVCHQYRMAYPKRIEWSVPGARGKSVDRATKPTGTGKFGPDAPQLAINVTQDVELWHTGAAPNRGWLLTFDSACILLSPTHAERKQWQLRITYEPE